LNDIKEKRPAITKIATKINLGLNLAIANFAG
jgi:hypothetical protein